VEVKNINYIFINLIIIILIFYIFQRIGNHGGCSEAIFNAQAYDNNRVAAKIQIQENWSHIRATCQHYDSNIEKDKSHQANYQEQNVFINQSAIQLMSVRICRLELFEITHVCSVT